MSVQLVSMKRRGRRVERDQGAQMKSQPQTIKLNQNVEFRFFLFFV